MKRITKEQYIWIAFAAILLLLFLMSSTDLIIKEAKKEVRAVTVIVDDSKDDYYVNFRKGMDQAAIDYNIDASFITLYERNNALNQMDLLKREVEDGVDAAVVVPVDNVKFSERLEKSAVHIPVIVMDNEWAGNWVRGNITMDYYEAGKALAEQVLAREQDSQILFLTEGVSYSSNARFYDGLASAVKEAGREFLLTEEKDQENIRQILEERVKTADGRCAVIALDKETLVKAAHGAEALEKDQRTIGLYGVGFNMEILSFLEDDIISGIITPNQYDEGYLAMEMALEAVESPGSGKMERILEHHYIEKTDIHSGEYEKMLFPIQ